MSSSRAYCNRCGKGFKSQSSVINHQSQPSSNCIKHYHAAMQKQPDLMSIPISIPPPTFSPFSSPSPSGSPLPENVEMMDITDDLGETSTEDSTPPQFYTDFYPGAAQILSGKGQTFLDNFDEDQYADERKNNLFYPFLSQEEWELASFLLQSSLSMAAIDQFLSLQAVSLENLSINISYAKTSRRSRTLDYPFGLRRSSATELRSFQPINPNSILIPTFNGSTDRTDYDGFPIKLSRTSRRRNLSFSITEILCYVFNILCRIHLSRITSPLRHSDFTRVQQNLQEFILSGCLAMRPGKHRLYLSIILFLC